MFGLDADGCAVDDFPFQCALKVAFVYIDACYVAHQAQPFQVEDERAADQADADQGDLVEDGRVHKG